MCCHTKSLNLSNNIMFPVPYATVIVGATPTKPMFLTGGATLSNEGALPTIVNAVAVGTKIVLANTIFNMPPSFHTVPGLNPTGLVGSANNVNWSMTIGVVEPI